MGLKFKQIGLLLILMLYVSLSSGIALGSTLDVSVYYNDKPADQAFVYIDNIDNVNLLGITDVNGILNGIGINSGSHTVIAKWKDGTGQQRSGERSFTAHPDSNVWVRIDLT
jgi:hypothetical protein